MRQHYRRGTPCHGQKVMRSAITDPRWIAQLAEAFVHRYLEALDGVSDVPPAWQKVFATGRNRYTSVLEDMVFGMSAHIIADLPHVLVTVGVTDEAGRSRVSDYHAMNDILGDAIGDIQTEVGRRYAPYLRWLDSLAGHPGELLTNYGIRLARAAAWYNAARLLDVRNRDAAAEAIQQSAIRIVEEVTRPPWWSARMLLRVLRVGVACLRRWPVEPVPPIS